MGFRFQYSYGEFFLPHSCDEWVIGSIEDMEQFIKEAQEILNKVRSAPQTKVGETE